MASAPTASTVAAAENSASAEDTYSTSTLAPLGGAAASLNQCCNPSPGRNKRLNREDNHHATIPTVPMLDFRDLCDASNEGIEAGGGAHLLRRNHEAALLLIVTQQHIQVTLHRVESFGTADVSLGAALVFGHKFHQHHHQLMDRLVIDAGIFREQVSDNGVVLRGRRLAYKRG